MNKKLLLIVIGAVSLLLMGLAVFNPLSGSTSAHKEAASDFYQRHPDWIWTANRQNAIIPMTGEAAFPDYFERHRELIPANTSNVDLTDYYFRHPELSASAAQGSIDLTDYYFRHINDQ